MSCRHVRYLQYFEHDEVCAVGIVRVVVDVPLCAEFAYFVICLAPGHVDVETVCKSAPETIADI